MSDDVFNNSDPFSPSRGRPSGVFIFFFVLFLVATIVFVSLFIWSQVTKKECTSTETASRKLILEGARITANASSISGSWDRVGDPSDLVALYASAEPFRYNSDGSINTDGNNVFVVSKSAAEISSQGNQKNSITLTDGIVNNQSYNALLLVSNSKTVSTVSFGPFTVYTQVTENLTNNGALFNIRDLTSCSGQVSSAATYTVNSGNAGIFRLGNGNLSSSTGSNTMLPGRNFLVRYTENSSTAVESPARVLCRMPDSSSVILAYWVNSDETTNDPIVCSTNATSTDNNDKVICSNTTILSDFCNWNYNTFPSAVAGQNRWCLTSGQSLNMLTGEDVTACLTRNGETLRVAEASVSGQWCNELTGTFANPTTV